MPLKPLTGNEAMAEAMRQINPDVVAAYPITPATEIVQLFSNFVADGLVDTEFVAVESEHSALSACIGAAAAGGRVMTSTASQGLALMHEMLYIAAALRLPIVICEVNRSLSAPINIHCDHSDTMGSRESGWIQIYTEDAQEGYDFVIQGMAIAERALLPVMVSIDGFISSHCTQPVHVLEDAAVQEFLGEPKHPYRLLFADKPFTVGPLDLTDYYFEHKRTQIEAMLQAKPVIKQVIQEFNQKFNKSYDIFELYRFDDADEVIIALSSTAGTAKFAIDRLREAGLKVGLLKLRVMRPFYHEDLRKLLVDKKIISVMDRSDTMSTMGGPVFVELRSALYELERRPLIVNYIYGLGGREIDVDDIVAVGKKSHEMLEKGEVTQPINFVGVRE